MRQIPIAGALLLLALPIAAEAAETITYRYDARGRLVRVERTGSVNNGVTATYGHDNADNLTSRSVSIPSGAAAPISHGYAVIPLNGRAVVIPVRAQ